MATVSDLFEVRYGHSLELNHLALSNSKDGIPFVSRKMVDNGVSTYVASIDDVTPADAGQLTVALNGNGVLSTFLQERPFYTGFHVSILSPRTPTSKNDLLFYCLCIKANRYRYSYGRQANRSLPGIVLPERSEIPSWVSGVDLEMFSGRDAAVSSDNTPEIDTSGWKPFRILDLFDVKKGIGIPRTDRVPGQTPYIGALDRKNGLVELIDRKPLHPANTITLNWNGIGGVGVAFYQPVAYWCSGDVHALYPKFDLTPAIGLFLVTVIRKERYRYSFGRKLSLKRLATSAIRLPASRNGQPDWGFMERYIKTLSFSSQIHEP